MCVCVPFAYYCCYVRTVVMLFLLLFLCLACALPSNLIYIRKHSSRVTGEPNPHFGFSLEQASSLSAIHCSLDLWAESLLLHPWDAS